MQDIKVRVPRRLKRVLEQMAEEAHLELSDIVRKAFDQFIARRKVTSKGRRLPGSKLPALRDSSRAVLTGFVKLISETRKAALRKGEPW